jgi:hypothetical protein
LVAVVLELGQFPDQKGKYFLDQVGGVFRLTTQTPGPEIK